MHRHYVWVDPLPAALLAATVALVLAVTGAFGIGRNAGGRAPAVANSGRNVHVTPHHAARRAPAGGFRTHQSNRAVW